MKIYKFNRKNLIELSTVSGYEDFPGYFVNCDGCVFSSRGVSRQPNLSGKQLQYVKKNSLAGVSPRRIAQELGVALKEITAAQRYMGPMKELRSGFNSETGYLQISLKTISSEAKTFHIHEIIAAAFLGLKPSKNFVVHHKDHFKTNNSVENLEYISCSKNNQYARDFYRLSSHHNNRLLEVKNFRSKKAKKISDFLESGAREIPEYPGYYIKFEGQQPQIYSIKKGLPRRLSITFHEQSGHLQLSLYIDKRKVTRYLHRLVALAYLGRPKGGETWVLHKDGNPQNNHLSNLKYGSREDNVKDAIRHGKSAYTNHYKIQDKYIPKIFEWFVEKKYTITEMAQKFGCHYSNISLILRRKARWNIEVDSNLIRAARQMLCPAPKKTTIDADAVRQKYIDEGTTALALASLYGVSKSVIHRILKGKSERITRTRHLQDQINAQLYFNVGKRFRAFDKKQYLEVWKLRKAGWTQQQIGTRYKVHRVTIKNILQGKIYKEWYRKTAHKYNFTTT